MWSRADEDRKQSLWPRDEAYWSMLLQQERDEGEPGVVFFGQKGFVAWEGFRRVAGRTFNRRPLDPGEQEAWVELEGCLHSTKVLTVKATGYNRGGLLVKIEGLQGFVPSSQIKDLARQLDEEARASQMATYVGREMYCRVIELDRDRNRIILSERAATPDGLQAEQLLDVLKDGNICHGRISNICNFGAFVDLGGLEGLVHISELSWRRIEDPSEVVRLNQEVDAYVLSVEKDRRRVGLSLKRLQPDPWDGIEERYQVGQVVEGHVTNVVDFGVFASISEGVEGLVHVSEMDIEPSEDPRGLIQLGEVIGVRILHIDRDGRRLGLSMRGV
jgi:small subunit ribosomal protein S1